MAKKPNRNYFIKSTPNQFHRKDHWIVCLQWVVFFSSAWRRLVWDWISRRFCWYNYLTTVLCCAWVYMCKRLLTGVCTTNLFIGCVAKMHAYCKLRCLICDSVRCKCVHGTARHGAMRISMLIPVFLQFFRQLHKICGHKEENGHANSRQLEIANNRECAAPFYVSSMQTNFLAFSQTHIHAHIQ